MGSVAASSTKRVGQVLRIAPFERRSVFAGGILILNICIMAEALRDVGELLDGRSRRHRLCVSVGDHRLPP